MLTASGILCTISRKGVITMVFTILLYCLLTKQYKIMAVFSALCILGGVCLFSMNTDYTKRFSSKSFAANMDNKIEFVRSGIKMFRDHPVRGSGYRGFYEMFGRYCKNSYVDRYEAHNIFITEIANRGIIGFLPFMLIFLYPVYYCICIIKTKSDAVDHNRFSGDMAVVALCNVTSFMINGYFAGGLFFSYLIVFLLFTHISFIFIPNETRFQK